MSESGLPHLEPLGDAHAIVDFSCGVVELDEWLKCSARTAAAKHVGRTYVWVTDDAPEEVLGYVTLAPTSSGELKLPGASVVDRPTAFPRSCWPDSPWHRRSGAADKAAGFSLMRCTAH